MKPTVHFLLLAVMLAQAAPKLQIETGKINLDAEFATIDPVIAIYKNTSDTVLNNHLSETKKSQEKLKLSLIDYNRRNTPKTTQVLKENFLMFCFLATVCRPNFFPREKPEEHIGLNSCEIKQASDEIYDWLIAINVIARKCISRLYSDIYQAADKRKTHSDYSIQEGENYTLLSIYIKQQRNMLCAVWIARDLEECFEIHLFPIAQGTYFSRPPILASKNTDQETANIASQLVVINNQIQMRKGFRIIKDSSRLIENMYLYSGNDPKRPFSELAMYIQVPSNDNFVFEKNIFGEQNKFISVPYTTLEYTAFEQALLEFTQHALIEAVKQPSITPKAKKIKQPKIVQLEDKTDALQIAPKETEAVAIEIQEETDEQLIIEMDELTASLTYEQEKYQNMIKREQAQRTRMVIDGEHYKQHDERKFTLPSKAATTGLTTTAVAIPTAASGTSTQDILEEEMDETVIERKRVDYRHLLQIINQTCEFDDEVYVKNKGSHYKLHGLAATIVKTHGKQDNTIPNSLAKKILQRIVTAKAKRPSQLL